MGLLECSGIRRALPLASANLTCVFGGDTGEGPSLLLSHMLEFPQEKFPQEARLVKQSARLTSASSIYTITELFCFMFTFSCFPVLRFLNPLNAIFKKMIQSIPICFDVHHPQIDANSSRVWSKQMHSYSWNLLAENTHSR